METVFAGINQGAKERLKGFWRKWNTAQQKHGMIKLKEISNYAVFTVYNISWKYIVETNKEVVTCVGLSQN